MFQPQNVICPYCGNQAHIITEDIPWKYIQYGWDGELVIMLCCPSCHGRIELFFAEDKICNNEIRYRCVNHGNKSLNMWRRMDIGRALPPVFRFVSANRTSFERKLDSEGQKKADRIYKWLNEPQQGQTLEEILGQVGDYTKTETWKKFKKNHSVMVLCSHDGKKTRFIGFNGKFNTVNQKNQTLEDYIELYLNGKAEEFSHQFCFNRIGRCAEVHAANRCLNKESSANLDDLRFSMAYLCRFGIARSYCLNCITLFPTVRNG